MRAAVLHGVNEKLRIGDVPDPEPGPAEALVKIRFAALNHRDVWIRKGQYAGLKFPCILGSDGAGTVESVGSEEDSLWVGKEVIINPSLGWGNNQAFQDPRTFRILGLPDQGTFAEKVAIPVENLAAKPDHLKLEEAAALPLAALTAYRAICCRAALETLEKVLVSGVGGGVASFAVQIAHAVGGEVYVTSSDASKIDAAVQLGAHGGVNYKEADWADRLKALAGGFDVIVDSAVGESFGKLLELLNPGGRIVLFGATTGNPSGLDLRRIFWKQASIQGTTMGSPRDFAEMVGFFEKHRLKPRIDSITPLEEIDSALDRMDGGKQCGKLVIRVAPQIPQPNS